MLFVYPTPQYPRKHLEYVFKALYHIANLSHIVSITVLTADYYTKLSDSMPEYYTNSNLVVAPSINIIMESCSYTGSVKLGNVRGMIDVNYGAVQYGLMTAAQYITGLIVVEFLLLSNSLVSALNYTTGNRHLRIFGIHFPLYHTTVFFTYLYSIIIVVLTWVYDANRIFYRDAVLFCASEMRKTDPTKLLEIEYDDFNIFTTAVYWPFAATCLSTLVFLLAAAVLAWNSWNKPNVLLSESDAPWESRGLMCFTSKPLLKLHTAQRKAILKDAKNAIKDGQDVRIVRSYQLMTEEDFQALVQAMRDRQTQANKEKQFEMLQRNFGDHESQIEDTGFRWRMEMPRAPASPTGDVPEDGADQFYDVEFQDYFTNNDPNGGQDAPANAIYEEDFQESPLFPDEDDGAVYQDVALDDRSDGYLYEYEDPDAPWQAGEAGYEEDRGAVVDESRQLGEDRNSYRRRHHRHKSPSGGYRGQSVRDPRAPALEEEHLYSPAQVVENDGARASGGGRWTRQRGRQAEIEDDCTDADAYDEDAAAHHN